MERSAVVSLAIFLFALLCSNCIGVSKRGGDLYPFGPQEGDESLDPVSEDSTSEEITFPKPVQFFGTRYSSAYVNENGLISFDTDVPFFQNQDLKSFEYPIIAGFYADVDIRNYQDPRQPRGAIYYRKSEDHRLLEKSTRTIQSKFSDAQDFQAKCLLIATWDDVGCRDGQQDKRNTFQMVLIAGDAQTYVELLYPDDGIQWTQASGKTDGRSDKPAQVGFLSDDNRHRILEHSGTKEIANINKRSNVGETGRYLFRVSGSDVQAPGESMGSPSERLQPLDIGGHAEIDADGMQHEDAEEEVDPEYDYGPDSEIYYDPGETAIQPIPPAVQGTQPGALEPAPPAPGPDVGGGQPTPEAITPLPTDYTHPADDNQGEDGIEVAPEQYPPPDPAPTLPPQPPVHQPDTGNNVQEPGPFPSPRDVLPPTHPPRPPPNGPAPQRGPMCAEGGQYQCNANADCRDYQTGSCCHCQNGYFGNGRECLKEGDPQRINGRFYGQINGIDIPETDLHTYVVTSDGRVYTALSQIPTQVGRPLLMLATIGSVMSWLFAKPSSSSAYNGYMLSGGILNRTATVHISDQHTATIQQEFNGKDAFNYLKTKVYVTGTLPDVPEGVEVEYGDYKEQYIRYGPGIVKSYSTKLVHAGTDRYQMTIDETIRYEECAHQYFDKDHTTVLRVDRSYNVYDPAERIVRYAGANTIETALEARVDPCRDGGHDCTGPQMTCIRDERSYRCGCKEGYELAFLQGGHPKGVCVDLDECGRALDRCAADADCMNTEGSYTCICRPGYRGSGFVCEREIECGNVICDPNAECLPAPSTQLPECVCGVGYHGNGLKCEPLATELHPGYNITGDYDDDEDEHLAEPSQPGEPVTDSSSLTCASLRCDRNAECRPTGQGQLECVCKAGYRGDGHYCTEEIQEAIGPACTSHDQCHRHGQCVYNQAIRQYQCQCRPPYSGDGRHCFLEAESCDKARNCDPNADCVWQQLPDIGGGYMCRCRQGYTGDGYRCTPVETQQEDQCNVVNNCDPHAQCNFDNNVGRFVCQCLEGYEGDGKVCTPKQAQPSTGVRPCQSVDDCHPYGHCVNRETHQDYVCECLPGYKGDGVTTCEPADQCTPGASGSNQCDSNAACVYDDKEMAYVCKCKDGFFGDGKICREGGGTCDRNPNLCHLNAQCVWDASKGYLCRCRPGFTGDGLYCEPEKTSSCEVQNNCHPHAQCQRNRMGEYKCVCNVGFEGDGSNCQPASDCLINPKLCDANAVCTSDNFRYVCRCKPGYHGNGQTCSADSELRGRALVFTHGVAVVQRGLLPDDLGKQIIVVPHQIAVGLDYDCQDDKLFWSDVSGHAIRSAYPDGSNLTTLFSEGLNSPEGLVVDWASKNVYYTDSQLDIIGVARQDGKYRVALVKEGLVNPRALAIDLFERKLYYSDWYRQKPVIGRLNLDGTGREDFITNDIALPNGLVILHRRRQLCWADAGLQRLECVGLNGGGRRVIHAPLGYPFGLTVHNEETFYWTDWEDTKIHSIHINGGNHHSFLPSVGGSGKLYGIVLLPEQCPPGESACSVNNGGCRFICLPDSRGSRSCVCPDNIPESECNELNGSSGSLH